MDKLQSKNLKLLYQDGIGSFYCIGDAYLTKRKPIVFINGQLEHHLQAMETFTNATRSSCYQYSNYYVYDSRIHTPYIWVYDYPIYKGEHEKYDTSYFASSLQNALNKNGLENVDIMGQSVGGIIGIRASASSLVDNVVAIHPPILSAPFANKELLRRKELNWRRKAIVFALNKIVDDTFGFQQENAQGYIGLEEKANLDKVKVVGSSIYGLSNLGKIDKEISDFVYYLSGMKNDGVVCWDAEILKKRGFYVVEDEIPMSHLKMASNLTYTEKLYDELILKKK